MGRSGMEQAENVTGVHRFPEAGLLAAAFDHLAPLAAAIEAWSLQRGGAPGFCRGCERWVDFTQAQAPPGDWANLMEGMLCTCGLNGRMRGILMALDDLLGDLEVRPATSAVFERLTPLFPLLERRLPGIVGSEYLGDDLRSGSIQKTAWGGVRHESLLAPSYKDASLDMVLHFDVLEHVPDMDQALRQCWRVLRPGGWMVFSCPFYEALDTTIVRARLGEGGIEHLLEPCFHGNPVDGGGALVFSQPGWDLWARVIDAGFQEVRVSLCFDPVQGVLTDACPYPIGHAWPVVFVARKP